MNDSRRTGSIAKLMTGIPGFDILSEGGLPKGRTTLISGTAGSGKTIFACQFLVEGIRENQPGVYVTFEEPPYAIRRNMNSFGWDIETWEDEGKWIFVDASPRSQDRLLVSGEYELSPLLTRLERAVNQVNAQRVSIDSLGALFSYIPMQSSVRADLFELAFMLRELGITTIVTSERADQYGAISRYGVEEFVADNVVILRNVLVQQKRRRTVEILKYRGTSHQIGEFPFTIVPSDGIAVIPFAFGELTQRSSNDRLSTGNAQLDEMCGGGFFRDSITLISGATGTGKTLLTTQFLAEGVKQGERCLFLSFEESQEQLHRNASGWNLHLDDMVAQGGLRICCRYPEATSLENHLLFIRHHIEDFQPQRVAIDSISALERIASPQNFREFLIGLNSWIKTQQIAGLFTSNTSSLTGGASVTETHISTTTDTIILLRYIEIYGEIRRGIAVLKMRGSEHAREIREFTITAQGMQISEPFRNITGILSGDPNSVDPGEIARFDDMFR
ncbi:MAG: circadian clock protein KaiC [Synechococcales bacterium]|nr:circadian clock protein KaiC [Synechococcales bacterium]